MRFNSNDVGRVWIRQLRPRHARDDDTGWDPHGRWCRAQCRHVVQSAFWSHGAVAERLSGRPAIINDQVVTQNWGSLGRDWLAGGAESNSAEGSGVLMPSQVPGSSSSAPTCGQSDLHRRRSGSHPDRAIYESMSLPVTPRAAIARKSHGEAGAFDIDLPLTRNGIECRAGGATRSHQVVILLPQRVTFTGHRSRQDRRNSERRQHQPLTTTR